MAQYYLDHMDLGKRRLNVTKLTPDVEDSIRTCLTHLNQQSMRWTNKKLAQFFNVSEVTMRRWIDKLQLARFVVDGRNKMSPFYNKDRNSLIYEDYWTHQKSLADIGKTYGMSRQRVHQIVKKAEKHRLKGLL